MWTHRTWWRKGVAKAVRAWRWSRIEARLPSLGSSQPGTGAVLGPIWKLIQDKAVVPGIPPEWQAGVRGHIRATFTGRQWPQQRKYMAGLVKHNKCLLCLHRLGHDASIDDPDYMKLDAVPVGTLHHRHVECPTLEGFRVKHAPMQWLRMRDTGELTVSGETTHGLVARDLVRVPPPEKDPTFQWHIRPDGHICEGTIYPD